jgi:hypothetical protein
MIIRTEEFNLEDPRHKGYSMDEVDYYAWIPQSFIELGIRNHRLTLRKNLTDGVFEIVRHYYAGLSGSDEKDDVIFHSGFLPKAGRFAEVERTRFHRSHEPDTYME